MSQGWNSGSAERADSGDNFAPAVTKLILGIETALTCYYGTTDPSSGAPVAWGTTELGSLWADSTNAVDQMSGDDLGATTKRWEVLTDAPTYGWRTLGLRGYVALEPNESVLSLSTGGTGAFVPVPIQAETSTRSIAARLLLRMSYPEAPTTSTYAEVRDPGTSTDAITRRIYPQVAGQFVTYETVVGLNGSHAFEYQVSTQGGGTTHATLDVVVLGYYERV